MMAGITRFRLNIDLLPNFRGFVRKLDQPILVVYSDVLKAFMLTNIGDDMVQVFPRIIHHGIMRAEFDHLAEFIGT